MFLNYWNKIKASPYIILINVFILLIIGLFSLFSISVVQEENSSKAFYKQLFFLGPAILLMLIAALLSKRFIHKYIYLFYLFTLFFVFLPFLGSKMRQEHQGIYHTLSLSILMESLRLFHQR